MSNIFGSFGESAAHVAGSTLAARAFAPDPIDAMAESDLMTLPVADQIDLARADAALVRTWRLPAVLAVGAVGAFGGYALARWLKRQK